MPVTTSAHRREHLSVLASAERRLLVWIARRLPAAINADHLSLLGLTAMCLAGGGFAAMRLTPWGAVAVPFALAANWFGDSLDGTVARVRGQERPRFGYYMDHLIDLAGSAALFAGLAVSGLMSPLLAIAVLAGYLLVSAEAYLATHSVGVFRMSRFGMGPTELRLLLVAGALSAVDHRVVQVPGAGRHLLFDVGGVVALAGFAVVFVTAAISNVRQLSAAEPRPQAPLEAAA